MRRAAALSSFVLAVVGLASPTGLAASFAATPALCNGAAATITSSAAVITGTANRDVIVASGPGSHIINAGAGDDLICGSPGIDRINAGSGADTVLAGTGSDSISGGAGNDIISGGAGNDIISGGAGNDTVNGGAGKDVLSGGLGNDTVTGGAGNDKGAGDAGADTVRGDAGSDALSGGVGDDTLSGGPGKDSLTPGTGQDYCPRDAGDTITGTCTIDASGPTIDAAMATSEVQAGSTATFMWRIDDASGVQLTWAKIGGPYGWIDWCGFPLMGERASGTPQSGVYVASCEIPADAVNATYTVYFGATDTFGQFSGDASATFAVTGGSADNSPPVVTDISASSPKVKIGEPLNVTWRATDETAVSGVIAWAFCDGFGDSSGRLIVDETSLSPTLVSGDEKDGTYQQVITLNQFAQAGECSIWISARDRLGNKWFFQTPVTFTAG